MSDIQNKDELLLAGDLLYSIYRALELDKPIPIQVLSKIRGGTHAYEAILRLSKRPLFRMFKGLLLRAFVRSAPRILSKAMYTKRSEQAWAAGQIRERLKSNISQSKKN